mmetsp:Transcript_16598/g.54057  ORF Transcript_16598/g.54057 Transcript_16598/m.54057 type:complete len:195 (+) Transcript_16598:42-626(+)
MEPRTVAKLSPPARLCAKVVRGFGRGSSQLGFPTANLGIRWDAKKGSPSSTSSSSRGCSFLTESEKAVLAFAEGAKCGIYAAWARVVDGPESDVYKVAMSVGWNPHFEGDDAVKEKTIECWLLHDFQDDFYGATLKVIVLAYVRDEAKFDSLDQLIKEIREDGDFCDKALDHHPDLNLVQRDPFFFDNTPEKLV